LVLGKNIREWCQKNSSTVNSFTDQNVQNVWSEACHEGGSGKLDMLIS